MCGIFGASLRPGANKKAALAKIKTLGIYNITRGRDASGIFINGKIFKSTKEFDDYIEEEEFPEDFDGNVIIGHTRQGSFGYKKTIDEAHPFLINEALVFSHNGTIKNTADLCKKYSVKEKDFNVDSLLLGTLLYTEGTNVLVDYNGAAALAYMYLEDPNTLYLYHGQSKNYKAGALMEERPLYFLETDDGIFYSSLENSLKAIRDKKDQKVENLNYNHIFAIKDGEFLDESVKIEREESNVEIVTTVHKNKRYDRDYDDWDYGYEGGYYPNNTSHPGIVGIPGTMYQPNRTLPIRVPQSRSVHVPVRGFQIIKDKPDGCLIFKESFPDKMVQTAKTDFKIYGKNYVYFHHGRYWIAPKSLVDGPIYLKRGGIIVPDSKQDSTAELYFFFRGVMLKNEEAYRAILDKKGIITGTNWVKDPTKFNFANEIAPYSLFPVTNLICEQNLEIIEPYRNYWFYHTAGKYVDSHVFTPKFSGRSYEIKDKFLVDIKSSHRENCILLSNLDVNKQFGEIMAIAAAAKKKEESIPGGGQVLQLPFQKEEEENKKSDNIFRWFFDMVFSNYDQVKNHFGRDEIEALRRFIRYTYRRDYYIEPMESQITEIYDEIIGLCITSNKSIGEFIDDNRNGESKLLMQFYDEVVSEHAGLGNDKIFHENEDDESLHAQEVSETISNIIEQDAKNINKSIAKRLEESEDQDDENAIQEAEVFDIAETAVIDLENLQVASFQLIDKQESDFAQEFAKTLITGVDGILHNLREPIAKFKKKELDDRIKKIIETKNIENGVL